MFLRLLPFILVIAYALLRWQFSVWQTRRNLSANSTPLRHPQLTPLLQQMGKAMDLPPIRAHVLETPEMNGLAAPDGRIFLTRGFLDQLDMGQMTPQEVASVIAHELGHVAHGHSHRRMVDFASHNLLNMVLVGLLARIIPGIGCHVARMLTALVTARLSRQDEFEADAFASALLVRAGIGTAPQKSLFAKLDTITRNRATSGPTTWLMSHPPPARRIAAIEALETRWQSPPPAP